MGLSSSGGQQRTCTHQFLDGAPSFKSIIFPDILHTLHSWGLGTEEEATHSSCCQEYSLIGAHIVTHSSVTSRHIHSHLYTHVHPHLQHNYMHSHICIKTHKTRTTYTHVPLQLHTLRYTKKLCTTTHMFICTHTHMHLPMQTIKCIHSYTHTITHVCTEPQSHTESHSHSHTFNEWRPDVLEFVISMSSSRGSLQHTQKRKGYFSQTAQQPVAGPGLGVHQQ